MSFHVYRFHEATGAEQLYTCEDEQQAQAEIDRINDNLARAGVPGWVCNAYLVED